VSRSGGSEGGERARLRPLHGGRHGLSPDVVAYSQRERLLAAIAEVVAERGYNKATIAQITTAASVSRRTFYEHFDGKEACFIAAYDAVDTYIIGHISEQLREQSRWPDRVATMLTEMLRFFASRPHLARLSMVESAAVGEGMASRRERTSQRLVALLEPGRAERSGERELAEGIEEAIAGGIMTLITRRVVAGEAEQLERFAAGIVEFALVPYLGAGAAREVARRYS
jgi:AcrR family transcriptional regulator